MEQSLKGEIDALTREHDDTNVMKKSNNGNNRRFDSDYWKRVLQTSNIFFMFMAAVSL